MTRKNVKVTRSVKELILETAGNYKFFFDKYRPLSMTDEDYKLWKTSADDWYDALVSECVLCGLDGFELSKVVERDGGLTQLKKMTALEFTVEFECGKKEVAA